VLRDVGTFPARARGIAPEGVTVKEVRQDMATLAQGLTGFNIPSLLGMVTGAPYFHAGARAHPGGGAGRDLRPPPPGLRRELPPDDTQLRQLAAFLLSIDESSPPPAAVAFGFRSISAPDPRRNYQVADRT
jgi:hypothetical protein